MKLAIPENSRLEIKFAAYELHLDVLINWLELHPAAFKAPYPNRRVNNIYYDSNGYAAYNQNLAGVSARVKLRYRWYGHSREPDAGTLETKCKRSYYGWKLRYPCQETKINPNHDWGKIRQVLEEQLSHEGRIWLNTYSVPVLINRYDRRYFISHDEKIRATIDTNQTVWDQRFKPMPNYDCPSNLPNSLVMEIKFDRADRNLASNLIQTLPMRVSRHSKYMNGVRAICGN